MGVIKVVFVLSYCTLPLLLPSYFRKVPTVSTLRNKSYFR